MHLFESSWNWSKMVPPNSILICYIFHTSILVVYSANDEIPPAHG